MNTAREVKKVALFFGALFFGAGCRPTSTVAPAPAPKVTASPLHTDIAGLAKIIALPRQPVAVTWQQTQLGDGVMGPSDLRLLAVLQFAPADADQIEVSARKHGAAQGWQTGELEAPDWFPAPVRKAAVGGANGKSILRGQKWNPDDFGKMSLTHGFVMRVGKTNFFVLSLLTN